MGGFGPPTSEVSSLVRSEQGRCLGRRAPKDTVRAHAAQRARTPSSWVDPRALRCDRTTTQRGLLVGQVRWTETRQEKGLWVDCENNDFRKSPTAPPAGSAEGRSSRMSLPGSCHRPRVLGGGALTAPPGRSPGRCAVRRRCPGHQRVVGRLKTALANTTCRGARSPRSRQSGVVAEPALSARHRSPHCNAR